MPSLDKDTFEGSLMVLLKNISEMKALADVDLPWVVNLETQVVEKIRSPERKLQQLGVIPGQQQNPMGNEAMGLPGLPPGGPPPMPGGFPPGPGPMPPDMGGMSAPPPSMLGAGAPGGIQQAPPAATPDALAALGL